MVSNNKATKYLCDEDAVAFEQVLVNMAAGEQLPHLRSESLRNTRPHQRRQTLRPYSQVAVPKRRYVQVTTISKQNSLSRHASIPIF